MTLVSNTLEPWEGIEKQRYLEILSNPSVRRNYTEKEPTTRKILEDAQPRIEPRASLFIISLEGGHLDAMSTFKGIASLSHFMELEISIYIDKSTSV